MQLTALLFTDFSWFPSTLQHTSVWSNYSKLPVGVNECVHGALWLSANSPRVYSLLTPSATESSDPEASCEPDHDEVPQEWIFKK